MPYVLVPAVILIWGLIGYKFYIGVSREEATINYVKSPKSIQDNDKKTDSFTLGLNYPDPFLYHPINPPQRKDYFFPNAPSYSSSVRETAPISAVPVKVVPPPVNWPVIEYLGIIENKRKGTRIAMLRIGSKDIMLKEKQMGSGIRVEKIFRDSITLYFQNEKKTVLK